VFRRCDALISTDTGTDSYENMNGKRPWVPKGNGNGNGGGNGNHQTPKGNGNRKVPQGNGNQRNPKAPKNKRPWVDRSGAQDSTPPPHKETRTCDRCGKYGHLKAFCKSTKNVSGVVLTSPVGAKSGDRRPNQNPNQNPKRHKPNGNRANGNGNGQAPAAQASMLGGAAAGEPDVAVLLLAANTAANAQLDATAAALRADAARVRFAANTK
jgi:hypothetical protein